MVDIILEAIFIAASENGGKSFSETAISEALQTLCELSMKEQFRLLPGITAIFRLDIDDAQDWGAKSAVEEIFVAAMYAQMQEIIRENGYTFNNTTSLYELEK
ncbi:MAG: hypothetical protein AAB599_01145 [Patescibacteria group bacterium]